MTRFITFFFSLCLVGITHAQQYQPVDDKSMVKFSIKNFGINTGGHFKGLQGTVDFDKASPEKAVFDISIETTTVNTDNDSRDSHLRKEEYFDVAKYTRIVFKSDKVTVKGSGFTVSGPLTIKGVTKTISIPFTATPKEEGYLFEGNFQINRRDFKVGGNSVVLGDNVTVSLSVFTKKK